MHCFYSNLILRAVEAMKKRKYTNQELSQAAVEVETMLYK